MDDFLKERESAHWYLSKAIQHHADCGDALGKSELTRARRHHEDLGRSLHGIAKAIGTNPTAPTVSAAEPHFRSFVPGPSYDIDRQSEELQEKKAASVGNDFRKVAFEESLEGSFEQRFQKSAAAALHNTDCTGPGYRKTATGCSLSLKTYHEDLGKVEAQIASLPEGQVKKMLERTARAVREQQLNSTFRSGVDLRKVGDLGF